VKGLVFYNPFLLENDWLCRIFVQSFPVLQLDFRPAAMRNWNNGGFGKGRKIKQRSFKYSTLSNGGKVGIHPASGNSVLSRCST
jgi:hypothetical protein